MTALRWRQEVGDTGAIETEAGHELARYSWSTAKNHPYFWDLRPLNHDGILTNTAPWDHRWHHGLWWSWKFLNDVLYWEDHEGYGGARAGLGRAHVVAHAATDDGGVVQLTEALEWRPDGSDHAALHEQRVLTVRADLPLEGVWAIDWAHSWTAAERAVLSTTTYPEHRWGGYAGLNYRAARSMVAQETIMASGGRRGRDAVHSHAVRWMAYAGNTDGAGTDEPNNPAMGGIAIIPDPDNATGATPAYVFSAHDDFGFLAAAPLMRADWTIDPGGTLVLRYRVVVLGGDADAEQLEGLYDDYVNRPDQRWSRQPRGR